MLDCPLEHGEDGLIGYSTCYKYILLIFSSSVDILCQIVSERYKVHGEPVDILIGPFSYGKSIVDSQIFTFLDCKIS